MKKHRNGASAPGEASPDSQKMSLVPCAALSFLALSLSGGRRGGHSVMGITGQWRNPEGDVGVCGGRMSRAGVGQRGDAGWAGAGRSLGLPSTGVAVGRNG